MIDAITIGDAFEDLIFSGFPNLPQLGEEAFASRLDREPGGGAVITAHGLARLGFSAALVASIGKEDSEWLLLRLRAAGVDTTLMQLHPAEPTGTTAAISMHNDRIFYSHAGANRHLRLDLAGLPPARLVHFACEPGPSHVALLSPLRQRGAFITLDVGWRPEWLTDPGAIGILREIDLFFPNEIEAARLTGEPNPERALEVCAERGLERVAIKCGARGARLLWEGKRYDAPAQAVEAIDTTGAGDCFDAGFIAALLSGWGPQDCLRAAVFCGSHSTRARGGVAGFPAREEFDIWRLSR